MIKEAMHLNNGFVVLHRKMLDWQWYKNSNTKSVFIHLILTANIKDLRYMNQTVERGSVITTIEKIKNETGLSVKAVRTALEHLKSTGEISIKTTNKFSVITIEKYSFFQDRQNETADEGQSKGKQKANEGQTKGKQRASIEEQYNKNNKDNKDNKGISCAEATAQECGESLTVETASGESIDDNFSKTRKPRKRKTTGVLTNEQQNMFELFWQAYPNKKSPGQAEITFSKLNPDKTLFESIMSGVERAKKYDFRFRESGRYAPYPSTWLNARGWLDQFEIETEQNKSFAADSIKSYDDEGDFLGR